MTNNKQKKLTENVVDPSMIKLAAGMPAYKNVANELRALALEVEGGKLSEEDIWKKFADIQEIMSAHKRAVDASPAIQENTKTRITKSKLRQIIQEELSRVLKG
tara:strand:+ start:581 stop:892 length:312 start_codon:yes stop_codon:yes gene_type:complete